MVSISGECKQDAPNKMAGAQTERSVGVWSLSHSSTPTFFHLYGTCCIKTTSIFPERALKQLLSLKIL